MNIRLEWIGIATILGLVLLAGFHVTSSPDTIQNEQQVSVEACEAVPDYDYEQMVSRVEQIKGKELRRNVSICTEQTSGGISTTPSRGQFASLDESGLAFFRLTTTTDSQRRSSLGHMTFSPSGGPIEIYLANQTVVGDVSWISYEALVAHELSDAIRIAGGHFGNTTVDERPTLPRTTDETLARQALANGISMYVADLYVEQHGGHLNVSALSSGERNWKRQLIQSVYASGYRYAEQTDRRTVFKTNRPNSTAQLLHPKETMNVTGFPPRPKPVMESVEHVRTDRIGELFVREVFESKGVSRKRATVAADGWTNDRMDYFRIGNETIITWRVTFRDEDDRSEFVETFDTVYDYQRVRTLQSAGCNKRDRYLATAEKSVTVLWCGS